MANKNKHSGDFQRKQIEKELRRLTSPENTAKILEKVVVPVIKEQMIRQINIYKRTFAKDGQDIWRNTASKNFVISTGETTTTAFDLGYKSYKTPPDKNKSLGDILGNERKIVHETSISNDGAEIKIYNTAQPNNSLYRTSIKYPSPTLLTEWIEGDGSKSFIPIPPPRYTNKFGGNPLWMSYDEKERQYLWRTYIDDPANHYSARPYVTHTINYFKEGAQGGKKIQKLYNEELQRQIKEALEQIQKKFF